MQPPLWSSALRIFDLSLGQMLWSRRSVFLGFVVGGPVVLAVALRLAELSGLLFTRARPAGGMIYGLMIWLIYVRFLVPVLGVFYGTSLIADEVEDKTLTYLFTRPIQRAAVIFGKYFAYLVCTGLLLLPSVVMWSRQRCASQGCRSSGERGAGWMSQSITVSRCAVSRSRASFRVATFIAGILRCPARFTKGVRMLRAGCRS